MGTKIYDNATDLITFSRASGGTALRKISYGSELVTNGTFDTDISGWTDVSTGTGTAVFDSGTALLTSADSSNRGILTQAFTTEAGKVYKCEIEITQDSGNTFSRIGTTPNGDQITSFSNPTVGVSTLLFVAQGTTTYITLNVSSGNINFDNISVKEVIFDQPAGTLTLFNHPNDIPRIEYDAAGVVKGLLIEEARTNLLTYSQDFTPTAWTKSNTGALVSVDGPSGVGTATRIIDNGATGSLVVMVYSSLGTYPLNSDLVYSFYAKADQLNFVYVQPFNDPQIDGTTYFNLSNGTVGTTAIKHTPSIENVGNGWYRCSIKMTSGGVTSTANCIIGLSEDGSSTSVTLDGTSSIYIYGAQFEAGSFPTSYIPTAGATATRAADIASIPTSAFGYNQKQGSVYVDGTFRNGDTIVTLGSTTIAADADGVKDYTTTYSADPSATGMVLNRGTYRDVKYYPRRLSNAQLQELTT